MTWDRREFLGALGVIAFGCGTPRPDVRPPAQRTADVRGWLRDAVGKLAAVFPTVHALAVTRTRTTAALDVLGLGVATARRDGVVLTVRDSYGRWREQATSDLTRGGIAAAVRTLGGVDSGTRIAIPDPGPPPLELRAIDDQELKNRLGVIQRGDLVKSSRIVYSAALIDIDDIDVWSVAPDHDRQHRTRRIRHRATRAAWSGTRPLIDEVERGWIGDLGEAAHALTEDEITGATMNALQQLTPGEFPDGEASIVLEPAVTAAVIDVAVRGLLTTTAVRRPEVARRLASGAQVSQLLGLVDDPTLPAAYGSFAFDDEGKAAAPVPLLEAGRVVGQLARGTRAGHVAELEVLPSNLVLAPGALARSQLLTDGWQLEGRVAIAYDPASDRLLLTVARARELRNGSDTGRVFANVEVAGELAVLLAHVDGVADVSRTTVLRDDSGGEPRWRSITAPWLRTRGFVRARRGIT